MKDLHVKYLAALFVLLLACTPQKNIIQPAAVTPPPSQPEPLSEYFKKCETEINNAAAVIRQENIIMNLSHLRLMAMGGQKYYLLERENLSAMIRSLTTIEYTDCLLINNGGTVVYTMYSDALFGKGVRQSYPGQPLARCYEASNKPGLHIEDIYTPLSDNNTIYVSLPIWIRQEFQGIIVILINKDNLKNIYTDSTVVIDPAGRFRIPDGMQQLESYPHLDVALNNSGQNFSVNNNTYRCQPFEFKELNWLIITPLPLQTAPALP